MASCKYFRKCSGCTRLQFPYVKQLHDKDLLVRKKLARFVEKDGVLQKIAPSPKELGYRTSTKIALHEDSFGRPSLGLYERGTKTVVNIPGCPVHTPAIEKLIARLFDPRRPPPAPLYRHDKRGFQPAALKFLTLRHGPDTGESGVVISHTGVERGALKGWVEDARLGPVAVYDTVLKPEDEDRVMAAKAEHLTGPKTFKFKVAGRVYSLTPMAFFQANHALSDAFVNEVASTVDEADTLLDLYGGFGPYGFTAAERCKRVLLVDGNADAIDAARAAAITSGVDNLKAFHDACEDFLEKTMKREGPPSVTHVIVNPPRGGLSPRVKARLGAATFRNLKKVTYVSCDLETLRRDLYDLSKAHGLEVTRVAPFDMFPQTDHVETVVSLCVKRC